jgi:hypothetical protein
MACSVSVARSRLAPLIHTLSLALQRLQKHLALLEKENANKNRNLKEFILAAKEIKAISAELAAAQTLMLEEEEYVALCDLIICGASMADYLIHLKTAHKIIRRHAAYWHDLTQKFKPFLKSVYYLDRSQQT